MARTTRKLSTDKNPTRKKRSVHTKTTPNKSEFGSGTRAHYEQVMTPNYAPMPIIPVRGKGSIVWDEDGKRYLDFAAGIATNSLGHAHPLLCKTITAQAKKIWHVSNLFVNVPAVELAQRLCDMTFAERVFFANSGSEANEAALKLARRYAFDQFGENPAENRKESIIAFDNSFHGRTFFTVCVGGQPKYSDGFGPKPHGIVHLPFNNSEALEKAVDQSTCAVILEPIQGEGGVVPANKEFVRTARELCDYHRALLIFDEVQTGVGRSGCLYQYQKLGITPDILTTAKGLGGGFPISAMLTTEAIANSLSVGSHGSTLGGNPLACAVANQVLEIIGNQKMLDAVTARGMQLKQGLEAINQRSHAFSAIRGEGLLLGCELQGLWQHRARDILRDCLKHGLVMLMAGTNVLRLAPALTISAAEITQGLAALEAALGEMESE